MRLHPAIATAALTATVLLSACTTPAPTGTNGPPATQAEETPLPTEPTLRIPETAIDGELVAEISAGDTGSTQATLYGYRLENFDYASTDDLALDCAATPTITKDVALQAGGAWSSIPVAVTPGRYMWVLTVDDLSTPCGDDGAVGDVVLSPELQVLASEEAPMSGAPFSLGVRAERMPAALAVPLELVVTGPWTSQPEALAAGCDPDAEDALSFTAEVTDDTANVPFEVTFDEPGVYAAVAVAPESAQSAAASSCDGAAGSATLIVVS